MCSCFVDIIDISADLFMSNRRFFRSNVLPVVCSLDVCRIAIVISLFCLQIFVKTYIRVNSNCLNECLIVENFPILHQDNYSTTNN